VCSARGRADATSIWVPNIFGITLEPGAAGISPASDLARGRREGPDTARRGLARIRDTDGTGLVLLPARHYDMLEAVSRWHDRLDVLERARAKPAPERVAHDYGDLTWLRHLDEDDLTTFISEIRAAGLVAYPDHDPTEFHHP